ncbi:hypothetical protein [Pectobacterium zantedeschiae]|uniref:hypothetical protein n=1 Tax=Pectobacterium zantedeschiae TaxID=2034769 RepID=UPI00101CF5E2|nr:hypothetical protein [Pectobacterium zantedeschiae]
MTAVVILYNTYLLESETLQSILINKLHNINLTLKIWNNGPNYLEEEDINKFFSFCSKSGINVDIFQDKRNVSLSKIYNLFINEKNYDYITILDQDSTLPEDFFAKIFHGKKTDIIIPLIFSNINEIVAQTHPYRLYDGEKIVTECSINQKIETVMSGITLSSNFTETIIKNWNSVFEERLGFYGIDSDFFKRLNEMESLSNISVCCKNKIHHSFALLDPNQSMSEFRKMELFYFKIFSRIAYQKKGPISTLWVTLRDFIRMKNNFVTTYNLVMFVLRKRHPRSIIDIRNHRPTHRL